MSGGNEMTRHVTTFRNPEASEGQYGKQEDGAYLDVRDGEHKVLARIRLERFRAPRAIKYRL